MRISIKFLLSMAVLFSTALCTMADEAKVNPAIAPLQKVFALESNSKALYDAFAVQADKDGYKAVASLFRATSKSEEIRADKRKSAIEKLGGSSEITLDKPIVKSTKENLALAVANGNMAKDKSYPALSKEIEPLDAQSAKYLMGAANIVGSNVKLFQKALTELDSWKASGKEFLVCLVCSYVTDDMKTMVCPICASPRDKFATIK